MRLGNKKTPQPRGFFMEPRIGLEPTTYSLRVRILGVLLSSVEFWKARGCHVSLDSLSGLVLAISGHFGCGGDQEVIRR